MEMLVRYILSSVCLRFILLFFFYSIYGAVCFQLTHFSFDNCDNISTYYRITIIKLEIWILSFCFVPGDETMVCSACLAMFSSGYFTGTGAYDCPSASGATLKDLGWHSLQNKIRNLLDQSTILPKFIYDKEGKLAGPTQILPVRVCGPGLILKTVGTSCETTRDNNNNNNNNYNKTKHNKTVCIFYGIYGMYRIDI